MEDETHDTLIYMKARFKNIMDRQDVIESKIDGLRDDLIGVLDNHERRMHREYTPDHHEQHSRLGAWFRRIDNSMDHVFQYLGIFLVGVLGWGLLTFVNSNKPQQYLPVPQNMVQQAIPPSPLGERR